MREICCVSASAPPSAVHVRPPSVVLYTPEPGDTLPPIAPIVPPKYLSLTGSHVCPPSVVLNTPPPVVPIQNSFGRAAEPETATERPPRKIPISRHFSAANTVESYGV